MITFVRVNDPELAVELYLSRLLYCDGNLGFHNGAAPSLARSHWSVASIREHCRTNQDYFCYAVED